MRALIFGSRGFMGRRFLTLYLDATAPSTDIADARGVGAILDAENPDVVINAAGKTGRPNVDWCEEHRIETLHGNVTGPIALAEECAKRGIYLVHLSSGCIYEGDNRGRGFSEEDLPNFSGSFYARTKAWSDQILKELAEPHDKRGGILILRLRMPFDASADERNLIVKLAKYPRVLDVQNSLTCIPDFLAAAKTLIERRRTGIYNVVNEGTISPFEIMETYRELVDPSHRFERLTLGELPGVVRAGRSNCVLATRKLAEEGLTLRPVQEAVQESLGALRSRLAVRASCGHHSRISMKSTER